MVHGTPNPSLYDKRFEISTNMFSNKTVFLSPFKFMSSYIFIFQQCILLTYLIHFKLNYFFFFRYAQIVFCYILSNLFNVFQTKLLHNFFSSTMQKLYFVIYFQKISVIYCMDTTCASCYLSHLRCSFHLSLLTTLPHSLVT
jgi:hypothetical protein